MTHLECKECKAQYPAQALYVCERCFGPLEAACAHSREGDLGRSEEHTSELQSR